MKENSFVNLFLLKENQLELQHQRGKLNSQKVPDHEKRNEGRNYIIPAEILGIWRTPGGRDRQIVPKQESAAQTLQIFGILGTRSGDSQSQGWC